MNLIQNTYMASNSWKKKKGRETFSNMHTAFMLAATMGWRNSGNIVLADVCIIYTHAAL